MDESGRTALVIAAPQPNHAKQVSATLAALEAGGMTLVRRDVQRARVPELIAAMRHQVDCVVLAGGDGLLGIGGIALRDTGLPLGIVPAGADNDLAHALGIPHDPAAAAAVILEGHVRAINLGSVNGQPFFTVASIGLTVGTARGLHRATQQSLARLRYTGAALRVLLEHRRFSAIIRCGSVVHRVRTVQITIGNARLYDGGMQAASANEIDDDALAVYSLEPSRRWGLLFLAPLFAGDTGLGSPEVRIARSPVIEVVTRQPQPITADGEVVAVTPARFSVLAKAVRVYAPSAPAKVDPERVERAQVEPGIGRGGEH